MSPLLLDKLQIASIIEENVKTIKSLTANDLESIQLISEKICNCFLNGNKMLIMGNGGSAADAQHIAGELVGRFKLERKGLPVIALTTDSTVLTALTNDYNFSTVFSRQVEALTKKGDILLGLSTSGNSVNVLNAFKVGWDIGTTNISLTGNLGGMIKQKSDLNINIQSNNVARIQEAHMLIYHILCEMIELGIANQ